MKTLFASLCMLLFVINSQASASDPIQIDPGKKLSILAALLTSSKVATEDRWNLIRLIEDETHSEAAYQINAFDCEYVGKSLRFHCEIRLGTFSDIERSDIVSIFLKGFMTNPVQLSAIKFIPLIDGAPER